MFAYVAYDHRWDYQKDYRQSFALLRDHIYDVAELRGSSPEAILNCVIEYHNGIWCKELDEKMKYLESMNCMTINDLRYICNSLTGSTELFMNTLYNKPQLVLQTMESMHPDDVRAPRTRRYDGDYTKYLIKYAKKPVDIHYDAVLRNKPIIEDN